MLVDSIVGDVKQGRSVAVATLRNLLIALAGQGSREEAVVGERRQDGKHTHTQATGDTRKLPRPGARDNLPYLGPVGCRWVDSSFTNPWVSV